MRRVLLVSSTFVAAVLGACHPQSPVIQSVAASDTLSSTEIRWAIDSGSTGFEGRRPLDGTLADSLRRLATVAYWEIEGGDIVLGDRLLRHIYRRGYRDNVLSSTDLESLIARSRDPRAWSILADSVLEKEPTSSWAIVARQAALRRLHPAGNSRDSL